MFEHAGFGANSAAPVVKSMLDAYFHYGEYALSKNSIDKQMKKEVH